MEIVRDGDDGDDGESSGGEAEAGVSDGSGGDAGPTDRFNLPREFFSSDVAASRAATNAAGDGDGVEPRERFGLVNRLKGAADDDKQEPGSKKRKKDTVEMRALAAFLGGDSEDRDGDEADAGKVEEMAKPTPVKKTTKESAPRPKTTDPEEGGIPMAQTAPKWWESEAPKADKTVATTGGKPAGLTKDFFAPRSTAPADAVTSTAAPVRDFFRSGGSAPFVPRANRRRSKVKERRTGVTVTVMSGRSTWTPMRSRRMTRAPSCPKRRMTRTRTQTRTRATGRLPGPTATRPTRTTRERSRRIPAARRTTSRTVRVTVIAGISTWWISTEIHPSRTP